MSRVQITTAIRRDAARSSAVPQTARETRGAGRRLLGVAAAAATVVGVGVAAPQALAAPVSSHQHAAGSPAAMSSHVASATSRKPFRIKAGRIYDVIATVRGVRTGERLGLEVYYWHRWHVKGSWKMHRGSYHFRGSARSTHPGLYTMRVQFLSKRHKPIKGTQSNRFQVRVLGFHVPKAHRPKKSGGSAVPATKLGDWTDIQCAETLPGLGHGLIIPSPVSRLNGSGEVNQVVWARDALPGGYYGNWYIANTDKQYIHPADPGIITITGQGDLKDTSYLDDIYLEYPAQTEYHQIAWDLQIQGADGNWYYVSSSWFTPASYIQWDQKGISTSQSDNCLTYQTAGH
jgi:hypothetical protein